VVEMDMRGGTLVLVTRPGVVVDADSLKVRYTDVNFRTGGESDKYAVAHQPDDDFSCNQVNRTPP